MGLSGTSKVRASRVAKRESHTIIAESMRVATQGRASMWTTRRASVRLTCSSVSQHNNVRRSSCSGAWNRKQQSWLAGKRRGNCRGRGTEQLRAASSAEMPSTLKGLVAAFSAVSSVENLKYFLSLLGGIKLKSDINCCCVLLFCSVFFFFFFFPGPGSHAEV